MKQERALKSVDSFDVLYMSGSKKTRRSLLRTRKFKKRP